MKLKDAIQETDKLRANQFPSGRVLKYAMRYIRSNKQLFIQAEVASGTDKNVKYQSRLVFNGIEWSPRRTKTCTVKYKDVDGSLIFLQKPTTDHHVMTRDSCFTGDTLIPLADGYSLPIKDLVGRTEFFVYSFDHISQKIVIAKAVNAKSYGTKKVIKLTLDNGEVIKCTPDHKFMLKSGEYKEAKDLLVTDPLMPLFYRDLPNSENLSLNRKVIHISESEDEEVYCITVPGYGNFAIDCNGGENQSSGVFVKNCQDYRFMWHWWIADRKALLGPRIPYQRVPGSNRPPKNPCVLGSTRIKLLNGTVETIENLANTRSPKEVIWLYAYDSKSGKIVPARGFFPRQTALVDELIEVTLDNGKTEITTVDHEFLTREGIYTEAQDLKIGQSLMPFYYRYSSGEGKGSWKKLKGYEEVKDPNGNWVFTHRRVTEVEEIRDWTNGSSKSVRHHIDFNKLNNEPSNLAWMDFKQHQCLHKQNAGWGWNLGRKVTEEHREQARQSIRKVLSKMNDPLNETYSQWREERSERARKALIDLHSNAEWVKKMKPILVENGHKLANHPNSIATRLTSDRVRLKNLENWKNEDYRKYMSEISSKSSKKYWEDNYEEIVKYRSSEEGKRDYQRARMIKLVHKLVSLGYYLSEESWDDVMNCYKLEHNVHYTGLRWKSTVDKYFEGGVNELLSLAKYNHKVVSIRYIKLDKPVPVYDITVPGYENFGLESGIFVHNSEIPGICKHLLTLIKKLISVRFLKADSWTINYLNRPKKNPERPTAKTVKRGKK